MRWLWVNSQLSLGLQLEFTFPSPLRKMSRKAVQVHPSSPLPASLSKMVVGSPGHAIPAMDQARNPSHGPEHHCLEFSLHIHPHMVKAYAHSGPANTHSDHIHTVQFWPEVKYTSGCLTKESGAELPEGCLRTRNIAHTWAAPFRDIATECLVAVKEGRGEVIEGLPLAPQIPRMCHIKATSCSRSCSLPRIDPCPHHASISKSKTLQPRFRGACMPLPRQGRLLIVAACHWPFVHGVNKGPSPPSTQRVLSSVPSG